MTTYPREGSHQWMVERYHPVEGWLCVFDSYIMKRKFLNHDKISDYNLAWQFLRTEILAQENPLKLVKENLDNASCWAKRASQNLLKNDIIITLAISNLPHQMIAFLGEQCENKITQWSNSAKVETFVERCQGMISHYNASPILTSDTSFPSKSAHDRMKAARLFSGLAPLHKDTLRIALNKD